MEEALYVVTRPGHYYPTYEKYIEKYAQEYKHLWIKDSGPIDNHRFYKLFTHPHCNNSEPVCLIQDVQTKQVYIIAESAILKEKYA